MKSSFPRFAALRKKRMQGGVHASQLLVPVCCFLALAFMLAAPEEAVAVSSQLAEEESALPSVMNQASPTDLEADQNEKSAAFLAPTADVESVRLTKRTKRPLGLAVQGVLALISTLMVVFVLFCFARRLSNGKEVKGARTRRLAAGEGEPPAEQCSSLDGFEEDEDQDAGEQEPPSQSEESEPQSQSEVSDSGSGSDGPFFTAESAGSDLDIFGEPPEEDDDDDDEDEEGYKEWDVSNLNLIGDDAESGGFDSSAHASTIDFWEFDEDDHHGPISPDEEDDFEQSEDTSSLSTGSKLFTLDSETDSGDEASSEDESEDEEETVHERARTTEAEVPGLYPAMPPVFPPGFHPIYRPVWMQRSSSSEESSSSE
ncbi:hypothetical protein Emed_003347 [Eimeria media]